MVMKLDKVVPFGRSLDEYIKMFDLSAEDLPKNILGAGMVLLALMPKVQLKATKSLLLTPFISLLVQTSNKDLTRW